MIVFQINYPILLSCELNLIFYMLNLIAAIDIWFKGKERNQIPIFALTITKPFRLTDAIYAGNYFSFYLIKK